MKTLDKLVKSNVILVTNCDDWESLYVNGVSVEQAHQIDRKTIVKYCLKESAMYEEIEAYPEDLELKGMYPKNLKDVTDFDYKSE